ncbi:MAG: L-seryl-tRNA(Sec) selenium transferase [Sphaerochaetaceae bacterium]
MGNKKFGIAQVETLLQEKSVSDYFDLISRSVTVDCVRKQLEFVREQILNEAKEFSYEEILNLCLAECKKSYRKTPQSVINCTGVIIHTNLGRSVISEKSWEAAKRLNTNYSSLEFDLETGKRGERRNLISSLLSVATKAESALVVNNNAAAIYLVLSALAKRKEVIVSRGELVQIGGGFRIPDILRQSQAKLVEVGTTNITTLEDYKNAITPKTALILKVHRSNFALRGFTDEPTTKELASILPEGVRLVVDQGSGVLDEILPGEKRAKDHIVMGADLVTFSADKVLGSVQGGIIVGSKKLIERLHKNPLYRVLRPGKTVLTLLQQTLIERLNGDKSPTILLASRTKEQLFEIGKVIIKDLPSENLSLVEAPMTLGGGSSPDEELPSIAIKVVTKKPPLQLLKEFRELKEPVIGSVEKGALYLNLAALLDNQQETLRESIKTVLGL